MEKFKPNSNFLIIAQLRIEYLYTFINFFSEYKKVQAVK